MLIDVIQNSKKGKTIGVFTKDKFGGGFIECWKKTIKEEDFKSV